MKKFEEYLELEGTQRGWPTDRRTAKRTDRYREQADVSTFFNFIGNSWLLPVNYTKQKFHAILSDSYVYYLLTVYAKKVYKNAIK